MKIIIVNIGMQMFRGGGENFDINISQAYRKLGYKTELISLIPLFCHPVYTDNNAFDRVTLLRSPWLYPLTSILHRYSFTRRLKGLRGIPRMLGQIIFELRVYLFLQMRKKEEFVVQSCALPLLSYLVTRFLGKVGIVRMPGPIGNFYDRYLCLRSKAIIANGDAYRQIKYMFSPSNLHFVNVGVYLFSEPSREEVAIMRHSLGIKPGMFVALYVGRCIPIKNLSLLIDAWQRYIESGKNGRLLIVGDGPERESLEAMAHEIGVSDSILFLGHKGKDELANFYHLADCCVLSSRYDNFPNVLLESLSCGTPCIATAVGGVPEIINQGENGLLVPPDDPNAFCAALLSIAERRCLFDRKKLRIVTLDAFNWDKSARDLNMILTQNG